MFNYTCYNKKYKFESLLNYKKLNNITKSDLCPILFDDEILKEMKEYEIYFFTNRYMRYY